MRQQPAHAAVRPACCPCPPLQKNRDMYGRIVGVCLLPGGLGRQPEDLNAWLVEQGLAVAYRWVAVGRAPAHCLCCAALQAHMMCSTAHAAQHSTGGRPHLKALHLRGADRADMPPSPPRCTSSAGWQRVAVNSRVGVAVTRQLHWKIDAPDPGLPRAQSAVWGDVLL